MIYEEKAELTVRSIVLAILLTIILAVSNAYLALKLGILTSASIPAAILSMGILRFFKNASILENNAVQTAASAGEAVAGGIVYTIPALIIIEYWHHFDYWTNFFIALSGGVLGVLFSIPLRRLLVHDQSLRFPEGQAIAEVLKSSSEKIGIQDIVYGGLVGALLELLQVGFKLMANSWHHWLLVKRALFGVGVGFSATLIGAGYLVGFDMACSIFLGAVLAWWIVLPIVSLVYSDALQQYPTQQAALLLINAKLRYLGIGAMLFAGIWTFIRLSRPLAKSIYSSLQPLMKQRSSQRSLQRVDLDIPMPYILLGIVMMAVALFLLFETVFPFGAFGLDGNGGFALVLGAVLYVLVIGFLFSVITAYFSGMVGVTASPGSSVVIAGILFAAWLLLSWVRAHVSLPLSHEQSLAAKAMVIIVGSVVTGIAAIANDNTQDLKVGQLVGATPWKQQVMLLLGVVVSSMVIPPVMELLFDVYGIAGIMPHAGMDASQSLPAPTAALLAAITEGLFQNSLPWTMMFSGALLIGLIAACHRLLQGQRWMHLSILGVAIGMYLPISSSCPIFLGGLIALFVKYRLTKASAARGNCNVRDHQQIGTRIACGLVAGAALLDVLLAVPFSMAHSPDALSVVGSGWERYGVCLAITSTALLAFWMQRRILQNTVV